GTDEQLRGLKVQDDGRVVFSGFAGINPRDVVVGRLDTDGALDTSFAGDGALNVSVSGGQDNASRLALDAQGRILVAIGTDAGGSSPESALLRVLPTGVPDASFGADGVATYSLAAGSDIELLRDVAVAPNGRVVATGWAFGGATLDISTIRVCP
ncbi:MAG: hypothetical protein AAF658_13685, partial [Myxococcota bacterium]